MAQGRRHHKTWKYLNPEYDHGEVWINDKIHELQHKHNPSVDVLKFAKHIFKTVLQKENHGART